MMVVSRRSGPIDTSGPVWGFPGEGVTLHFAPPPPDPVLAPAIEGLRLHLRALIPAALPRYINDRKRAVERLLEAPRAVAALFQGGFNVLGRLFELMSDGVGCRGPRKRAMRGDKRKGMATNEIRHFLGHVRRWYVWCTKKEIEGFDPDVANAMTEAEIRRGTIGSAVLRMDSHDGPLPERDAQLLEDALWEADRVSALPVDVVAAGLLMTLLGPNPENLRKLQEHDLVAPTGPGRPHILMMPRIKKRSSRAWNGERRAREISPELAAVIGKLIEANRADHPPGQDEERPLFRRKRGDVAGPGATRTHTRFFQLALERIVRDLDLRDGRGEPMRLYPRRLRYAFAKRMAAQNVDPRVLADLLDHSDLSCVLIYYNDGLDLVRDLDAKMGRTFQRMADLFLGSTTAALLENDPDLALLLWEREPEPLAAPLSCLSCNHCEVRDADALRRIADAVGADPRLLQSVGDAVVRHARARADDLGAGAGMTGRADRRGTVDGGRLAE